MRTPEKSEKGNSMNTIAEELKKPHPHKCQRHPSVPKAFLSPFTQRRLVDIPRMPCSRLAVVKRNKQRRARLNAIFSLLFAYSHEITIFLRFFLSIYYSYFFEKPTSKCDVHARNLAKSLNELYTDPAPNTLLSYDMPHEFPLTRSVSTTTDIFSTGSNGGFTATNSNSHKSLRTFTPQPNKRPLYRQECQLQNGNFQSLSRDGSRDSLNDTGTNQTKGILMNRTKSKDELFMEFCRKAGQRPKPKDIYFIDHTPYDDVAQNDVFVVQNYATIRKNRRNSNVIEAAQKATNVYNSNQSLNYPRNNTNKAYATKNMFDGDGFGGSSERVFLNNSHDNYLLRSRGNSRDSNVYSSRTLPKDFLKRNVTYDMDEMDARRVTANGLFTPYNLSMTLPSTADAQVLSTPAPTPTPTSNIVNPTTDYYQKSFDTFANRNSRQRDANTGNEDTLSVQWPSAIPSSPRFGYTASYSPNTQRKPPPQMSTFYSQHFPRILKSSASRYSDVDYENTNCNSNGEIVDDTVLVKENEAFDTFDLDRLERERRKSHASLFEIDIDFGNGTPV